VEGIRRGGEKGGEMGEKGLVGQGWEWGKGGGREEEVGLGKGMSCSFLHRAKPGTLLVIHSFVQYVLKNRVDCLCNHG
jgi:hypothetical protein